MKTKLAAVVFIAVLLLSVCGCSGEAVSLTELPDPTVSVNSFFGHLENEDYAEADALVYNYVTLGMTESDRIEDPVMQVFYRELNAQRSYEIVMEPQITGKNAVMTVKVTTLDLRKVYDPLIVNVKESIRHLQYVGEKVDTEEAILAVASEELGKLLSGNKSMTTSGVFAVELVYSKGEWRLVISDELYSALIGYAI